MMIHDRYFFNATSGEYTVNRYLDDLLDRFGGIDAVLVWPPYPNLGIDNRNQFSMARSMPGGVDGVKGFVKDFHDRGVKVFFPYTPWDIGTNTSSEDTPAGQLAVLLGDTDADGYNGDTMSGIPFQDFYTLAAEALGRVPYLEPEQSLSGSAGLSWTAASWGYGWQGLGQSEDDDSTTTTPKILPGKFRFLSKDHMVHVCNRWATSHTLDILNALFNGYGFEAWENVWGLWNSIVPFDAELLRRAATVLRHFGDPSVGAGDSLLHTDEFEPFVNVNLINDPASSSSSPFEAATAATTWGSGVVSTRFCNHSSGRSLYLLVNTNATSDLSGVQLAVPYHEDGATYFDVYHGTQLKPETVVRKCLTTFLPLDKPLEATTGGSLFSPETTVNPSPVEMSLWDCSHQLPLKSKQQQAHFEETPGRVENNKGDPLASSMFTTEQQQQHWELDVVANFDFSVPQHKKRQQKHVSDSTYVRIRLPSSSLQEQEQGGAFQKCLAVVSNAGGLNDDGRKALPMLTLASCREEEEEEEEGGGGGRREDRLSLSDQLLPSPCSIWTVRRRNTQNQATYYDPSSSSFSFSSSSFELQSHAGCTAGTASSQTKQQPQPLCLTLGVSKRGRVNGASVAVRACDNSDDHQAWALHKGGSFHNEEIDKHEKRNKRNKVGAINNEKAKAGSSSSALLSEEDTVSSVAELSAMAAEEMQTMHLVSMAPFTSTALLSFEVESNGFGAVLSQPPSMPTLSEDDEALLVQMAAMTEDNPLNKFSKNWPGPLSQVVTPSPETSFVPLSSVTNLSTTRNDPPKKDGESGDEEEDVVKVELESDQTFTFHVVGMMIEDGCCPEGWEGGYFNQMGPDFQYPWEPSGSPQRNHTYTFHGSTFSAPPNNNNGGKGGNHDDDSSGFTLDSFYIDVNLATNAEFRAFLTNTSYVPSDTLNFLKDWEWPSESMASESVSSETASEKSRHQQQQQPQPPPTFPAGWDNKPITYVSLEDARAFCAWKGKRLPQEWEWQLAAQGPDVEQGTPARLYPWGDQDPDAFNATATTTSQLPLSSSSSSSPASDHQLQSNKLPVARAKRNIRGGAGGGDGGGDGTTTTTTATTACLVPPPLYDGTAQFVPPNVGSCSPDGDSAYGLADMAGSVWQWTSEFIDEHTRAASLRGGSAFRPQSIDQFNNNWYFPGGAPYDSDGNPIPWATEGWGNNKWPLALSLQSHGKLLLMAPAIDRAATIGFRCAADA